MGLKHGKQWHPSKFLCHPLGTAVMHVLEGRGTLAEQVAMRTRRLPVRLLLLFHLLLLRWSWCCPSLLGIEVSPPTGGARCQPGGLSELRAIPIQLLARAGVHAAGVAGEQLCR